MLLYVHVYILEKYNQPAPVSPKETQAAET